jgi:hypothetical protein
MQSLLMLAQRAWPEVGTHFHIYIYIYIYIYHLHEFGPQTHNLE